MFTTLTSISHVGFKSVANITLNPHYFCIQNSNMISLVRWNPLSIAFDEHIDFDNLLIAHALNT